MPTENDRCVTCLIPKTTRNIDFNNEGVCGFCLNSDHELLRLGNPEEVEAELLNGIEEMRKKGEGRKYDCLLGLSGGRDSSFLLHRLVKRHNLRVIAAYYRTPFTPQDVDDNVKRMTQNLDVPLVEMPLSQEYHRKVAKKIALIWKKSPTATMASLTCAPCKMLNPEVFKIARQHDVKTIVFGVNKFEKFQAGAGVFRASAPKGVDNLKSILSKAMILFRRGFSLVVKNPSIWRFIPLGFKASFLYLNPHMPYFRLRYRDIHVFNYFSHTDWNEDECDNALEEIGWKLPRGCISTWKTDCIFAELKNYMFMKSAGLNLMEAMLSNMVRDGVMTREQALERLQKEGRFSEERFSELERILEVPHNFFEREIPEETAKS